MKQKCSYCNGKGKIQIFLAEDNLVIKICPVCKGRAVNLKEEKVKKLSNQEKWLIRRLVFVIILGVILAIPFVLLNEWYFISKLGWQSIAFPVLLCVVLLVIKFVWDRIDDINEKSTK